MCDLVRERFRSERKPDAGPKIVLCVPPAGHPQIDKQNAQANAAPDTKVSSVMIALHEGARRTHYE